MRQMTESGYRPARCRRDRRRTSRVPIALVATLVLLAIAGPQATAEDSAAKRAINRILDTFEQGYLEEDPQMIADLLADEGWALAMPTAHDPENAWVFSEEVYLDAVRHQFRNRDYTEHRHVDRQIEVMGPIAVSTSTLRDTRPDGTPFDQPSYHVYARIEGEWQVVFTCPTLAE